MDRSLHELKSLTNNAMMRGWLSTDALWEIIRLFSQDKEATVESLLSGWLSAEQLEELFRLQSDATVTPSLPPNSRTGGVKSPITLLPDTLQERYNLAEELGEGGSGRVCRAFDRKLDRVVAVKQLKAEALHDEQKARFLREARLTARLEHPNIIPIYDVEVTPESPPFYVMRLVQRRSMQDVLRLPLPREEWPLSRLFGVFAQVCRAVAYAHDRGVIHRDLKPENILLGDYGEVYVADWGIAKLLGELDAPRDVRLTIPSPESYGSSSMDSLTEAGVVLGTVGYMAPEQIAGGELDHRADLFSLGVILYQILTGHKPFRKKTAKATLEATIQSPPRPPRELNPAVPVLIEELCLRLLAKSPEARPSSAAFVAQEIEAFLEGAKEKERRRQAAAECIARAAEHAARYEALCAERDTLRAEAARQLLQLKSWEPLPQKQAAWALEDQARRADAAQAKEFAAACEEYSQALAFAPDASTARDSLAALYLTRALAAEDTNDEPTRIYYEALVKEHDTQGYYLSMLRAEATLLIESQHEEVSAARFIEEGRVLRLEPARSLGAAPCRAPLPPGSYLLRLRSEHREDALFPIVLRRSGEHKISVRMYTRDQLGEGFVYIPGGECWIGGDPEAVLPLPRQSVMVKDFAMMRLPVTLGQYLEFLNDLQQRDPAQAKQRVPRELNSSDHFAVLNEEGRWLPSPTILVGDGLRFCPKERFSDLPVTAIDWFDAVAYCKWRSARDGCEYRLPTEAEYEKAARGADERAFPWGNRYDPLFLKAMDSRPGFCQMELPGAFPLDESPYGVQDLAGSMRCWVADIVGELSMEDALQEQEEDPDTSRAASRVRVIRGGSWLHPAPPARSASRTPFLVTTRYSQVGFRLVKPLG